jgi:hypothetical protein
MSECIGADLEATLAETTEREGRTTSVIPWYYDIFVSIDCS